MSNFKQNTVEVVGDAALADSIVDRSITELQDNITTSIAKRKFSGCAALKNVIFQNVTEVKAAAFYGCKMLQQADFEKRVVFRSDAFYGCSELTALILRNTEGISKYEGNLSGTSIASGTGYIYVPAALVDAYKESWSSYANQIRAIEDYPEVCDKYTWEGVFAAIDNGTYASVYSVGDLVPLDLGSEGVVNMRIEGFDVDALSDGSGTAPIRWIADKILATKQKMNSQLAQLDADTNLYIEGTGAIGGWGSAELRTYLNSTIKALIPTELQNRIKTVKKKQTAFATDGTVITQETDENVWIPNTEEVGRSPEYPNDSRYTRPRGLTASYSDYWIRDAVGGASSSYYSKWVRANISTNNQTYAKLEGLGTGYNNGNPSTTASYVVIGFCT